MVVIVNAQFFVYIVSCVISGRLGTATCLFAFVGADALLNVCELVFSRFFLFYTRAAV